MKKIALTGNMGTGKSFVLNCIKEYGVFVMNVDVLAKEVRQDHLDEIRKQFQCSDEKTLAKLIFNDETKSVALEKILYPFMIEKMKLYFEQHNTEFLVVVEVPLLFEKKWEKYFDEVWLVISSQEKALERLNTYRHITKEDALLRLRKQMPLEEKVKKANEIIYNETEDVKEQIECLLRKEGFIC